MTATTSRTAGEPIAFADVQVGDVVTFATRDNGFGGSGDLLDRTGTVTTKTEKTVIVSGVEILRYAEYGHTNTRTARLRKADWYDRCVRLASTSNDGASE